MRLSSPYKVEESVETHNEWIECRYRQTGSKESGNVSSVEFWYIRSGKDKAAVELQRFTFEQSSFRDSNYSWADFLRILKVVILPDKATPDQIRTAFDLLDPTNSGSITVDGFAQFLKILYRELLIDDIIGHLERAGIDRTEKIDFNRFQHLLTRNICREIAVKGMPIYQKLKPANRYAA
ncbi:unnamed protein product [Didymodactylos carnosus]|uniref:EF-hand domain-containing protein n=2 Tax=Didymodactylos carnosus TaxID=1234261 RepID=A0A815RI22_9BILA|nr:unnamed protein product [Didymodactylos carnosus]CAF4342771.1 unnamed protein product [Didymodactylos carnosus]